MILAAGRGERMRPLTDKVPKPLLPCRGRPLIDRHLAALADAGLTDVVINLGWLGDRIRAYVGDGSAWGLSVHYSDEGEHPLETAGGIRKALPLLGTDPFVVINGDILTDYPLAQPTLAPNDLAHLVLVDRPPDRARGDFELVEGRVRTANACRFTFSGIGLYRPELFADRAPGHEPLAPLLNDAIAADRISGEHYTGLWHDIGTPRRLERAAAALAHGCTPDDHAS